MYACILLSQYLTHMLLQVVVAEGAAREAGSNRTTVAAEGAVEVAAEEVVAEGDAVFSLHSAVLFTILVNDKGTCADCTLVPT